MSASCCGQDTQFDGVSTTFKRALWIVIAINGVMFIVEMAAGAVAGSKALQADALDFLGDTATYAISLFVIGMSLHVRATAALIKGLSLAAMGLWVFGSTAYQVLVLGVPSATVMGSVGVLALLANLASVFLLMRFKDGDANVRSVWLCSRNDAIGNVAVIGAGSMRLLHRHGVARPYCRRFHGQFVPLVGHADRASSVGRDAAPCRSRNGRVRGLSRHAKHFASKQRSLSRLAGCIGLYPWCPVHRRGAGADALCAVLVPARLHVPLGHCPRARPLVAGRPRGALRHRIGAWRRRNRPLAHGAVRRSCSRTHPALHGHRPLLHR